MDVLVSVQSKDVLLVEERIQSDKKSKRTNKSHVWQKLLEHESVVMDMVKHFSSTNYSATKLQLGTCSACYGRGCVSASVYSEVLV